MDSQTSQTILDHIIKVFLYTTHGCDLQRTKTLPNISGVNCCAKLIFVYILKYLGENPLAASAHEAW